MPEHAVRIVLRPVASSLPLGFFAFAGGTVLLTALELKWVPATDARQLMVLRSSRRSESLAYGGNCDHTDTNNAFAAHGSG